VHIGARLSALAGPNDVLVSSTLRDLVIGSGLEFEAAKARQATERLALGADGGAWEYVVCNEAGLPYHPQVLSRYWQDAIKAAGLRPIKLHAARHTAATHMPLQGIPVAVIAAWIGHKDASLTMRLYAHSQDDALKAAGDTFNRVVIPPVILRRVIEQFEQRFRW
jgi:hypothetical protein